LLEDSRIRQTYFSSEEDATCWRGVLFATVTLLSKPRLGSPDESGLRLGSVWRVKCPSRFGRDALRCGVLVNTYNERNESESRFRLTNVHLDSLPIQPSQRPQQINIAVDLLKSASCGLVARDFNAILPEDESLVADYGLEDAWAKTYGGESGFIRVIDCKAPFPPARLDKIAITGINVEDVEIMHPGVTRILPLPRKHS
jgi:tyrosyl-DNA phosphodiesterase 2